MDPGDTPLYGLFGMCDSKGYGSVLCYSSTQSKDAAISFITLRLVGTLYLCPDLLRFFKIKA